MKNIFAIYLLISLILFFFDSGIGEAQVFTDTGQAEISHLVPPSNIDYAGLEKDILLYADTRYQVSQTGSAQLNLATLFDGKYRPFYTTSGNIRANKVVVNATGADYVFDSTYHLMPLDSLNNYIKKHQHLPGIPSAEEMKKEGINLGNAYTNLLEKIEEMTRYIIKQNKVIGGQNKKIYYLSSRVDSLMKKTKL